MVQRNRRDVGFVRSYDCAGIQKALVCHSRFVNHLSVYACGEGRGSYDSLRKMAVMAYPKCWRWT
ncbi:hypothetical protein LK429_12285 [Hoylesella buccalis]|uniref:hypothetical protein n=1 Tax=Hoylesella buccalis TaxID=28127 RepID=UPI001D13EAA2|nr:hypothetical protein [Hoylesella buccalis]UEA62788.1 hypothetical protein LK429_12285 [Hoylesella buccalis]UWP49926.1 hypothetical protein NQ518_02360 [Hoylesella buccalis ATCC 35310]